jgi:acyl carrier protein
VADKLEESTEKAEAGAGEDHEFTPEEAAAFEKFKACAVDVLQVPEEKVVLEARFGDDLEADSLDLVELVMALEEAFEITVEEDELDGVETVRQAFSLVTSKI